LDWITLAKFAILATFGVQVVHWLLKRRKDAQLAKWRSGPIAEAEQRWLDRTEQTRRGLVRPGLRGKAIANSKPGPLDTRVGGPLIVAKGTQTPSNEAGQALCPLLVIRLSDLPDVEGNVLPRDGWVQVLVEAHEPWEMPTPTAQGASFRVLHYPAGTEFDVHPVDMPAALDHLAWDSPEEDAALLIAGYSLEFEPVQDPALNTHYKLESLPDGPCTKAFDEAFDAMYYANQEERPGYDVMIGGQAVFTQEDIRYEPEYEGFENLIGLSASGSVFAWGDSGEGTIMVPEKDLRSGRLQNAVFYFDFH